MKYEIIRVGRWKFYVFRKYGEWFVGRAVKPWLLIADESRTMAISRVNDAMKFYERSPRKFEKWRDAASDPSRR